MWTRAFSIKPFARFISCIRLERRSLLTLAIETSCDDTCVAILEKSSLPGEPHLHIHHHEKVTSNSLAHRGIHPLVALQSHQQNLAFVVQRALACIPAESAIASDDTEQGRPPGHGQHGGARSIDRARAAHDRLITAGLSVSPGTNDPPAAPTPRTAISVDAPSRSQRPPPASLRPRARVPDFVSVTRGPGMRSNLNTGLDLAKGLAVAWNVPLLAVNHMQAHALTPRLVSALQQTNGPDGGPPLSPSFPFLSLLVSGGHTMIIHSKSLVEHPTLAETEDIAAGDAVDKIARVVLPPDVLASAKTTMYGPLLEQFVFPAGPADLEYTAPSTRAEEVARRESTHGWFLTPPFANAVVGYKKSAMRISFSGLTTAVADIVAARGGSAMPLAERRDLARAAMTVVFEHLASRTASALDTAGANGLRTVVVSGGVAANRFLKNVLRAFLDARGHKGVALEFPPVELCTDNAAMIGWTALEMHEAGYTSDLGVRTLRRWALDPAAADGGVLGVGGWLRHGVQVEPFESVDDVKT